MVEQKLTEKPDLLALAAADSGFFPALLESRSQNSKTGRYDILMAAPACQLVAFDYPQLEQLLNTIDSQPSQQVQGSEGSELPFQWGWLVYFSYESAYGLEPGLANYKTQSKQPLAVAIYCQGCVVYDHQNDTATLCSKNQEVAASLTAKLVEKPNFQTAEIDINALLQADGEVFKAAVKQAKELITLGDIYQANLSRQYHTLVNKNTPAAALYDRLREANPAPFCALLQLSDFAVISSSPERLFKIQGEWIETRPIAGTRPRGDSAAADAALVKELLETPKERAEHIMLIDLERNDVGRVSQSGTVEVDELMAIESYQHVHHIVSNVKGKLQQGVGFVDALRALFPGGTITGCPKIRCMQIIHDIESSPRGAYTGSLGYLNHDGRCDLNILIRTVCLHGDEVTFNAGAGIVFDSDPIAELEETRHKAEGMVRAMTQSKTKTTSSSAP